MDRPKVRLLVIGYGNIARRIARILSSEVLQYPRLGDLHLIPVGVFTQSHGALENKAGMDWSEIHDHFEQFLRFTPSCPDFSTRTAMEMIKTMDYDILVELSPLNIREHGEPALSHIRTALEKRHHVVTANKGPLAFASGDLLTLARQNKVFFRFETTVMDGVPLFKTFTEEIAACRVESISGILNSTTNFVLTECENGRSIEAAVAAAQQGGFAEADPSFDLDGWDGAAKIAVLARILMNSPITPLMVERESLSDMQPEKIREVKKEGKRVKYLCDTWREGEVVHARVAPKIIDAGSLFAGVNGTSSIIQIKTDGMVPLTFYQESPTLTDTAFGVLNDLAAIARKIG